MSAPLIYHWDGECMKPLGHFAKAADKFFVIGQNYRLEIVQPRSVESHRHYFAVLNEAWANLPEVHAGRWATVDHLRKWALVQAGYRHETTYVAHSKAEAVRFAAFMRSLDDYAVVTVEGNCVHHCRAKSQSMAEMSRKEFGESKQAVLEVVAKLIGVSSDDLARNAGRAA